MSAATHFNVVVPLTTSGGVGFSFTVTALDVANAVDTGYAGVVHFSSSDSSANLPATTTLVSGTGVFSATLNTQGGQWLRGKDNLASISGTSNLISVLTSSVTHIQVLAATSVFQSYQFAFTVQALDQSNTIRPDYKGTVHLTSNDSIAFLSADATLTGGVGIFTAVLNTAKTVRLSATDTVNAAITGVDLVSVLAAPVIPSIIPPGNIWTEIHYPYPNSPQVLQVSVLTAGASGPYAYDFSNDPLFSSSADTINSLVNVVATPIVPNDGSAPPLNILLSTTSGGNLAIAVFSGPKSGVEYLVSFTILTTDGYTRIGRGLLDIN